MLLKDLKDQFPSRGLAGHAWGVFAGLLSALLLTFTLSHADSLLVLLLVYFVPLPLLMAGFGAGALSCLFGLLSGTAALLGIGRPDLGIFYLLTDALPALALSTLALRSRLLPTGQRLSTNEGSLLALLIAYPCLVFLGVNLSVLSRGDDLLAMTRTALTGVKSQVDRLLTANGQTLTQDMQDALARVMEQIAHLTPSLAMSAWLFSFLIVLYIAEKMLDQKDAQKNWTLRPPFQIFQLRIPVWILYGAAVSGLASFYAPAPFDYIGLNLSVLFSLPLFLTGIIVTHAMARRMRFGLLFLIVFYLLISVFVYLVPLVALLGVVDQWADFRKRFAESPNSKGENL